MSLGDIEECILLQLYRLKCAEWEKWQIWIQDTLCMYMSVYICICVYDFFCDVLKNVYFALKNPLSIHFWVCEQQAWKLH